MSDIKEILIEPEHLKFIQNSNAKVFKRFTLDDGKNQR